MFCSDISIFNLFKPPFHIYLLGREEKTSLAEKHSVLAFDGEPVTDEEVEFLKSVLVAKRASENM